MYNLKSYNSIFKILGAVGVITAIWYFTPILDLLQVFAVVVLIPLTFLSAIGLLGDGMFNSLVQIPAMIGSLKGKINEHAENIKQQQAA